MFRENDARQTAERELESGENILWVGWPDPSASMRQAIPIVIFGIPWTGFILFWIFGAAGFGQPQQVTAPGLFAFFPLFGLPFLIVGIGMLSSPYWAARKARATVYAITDRRIIVIQAGRTKSVQSYQAADISDLQPDPVWHGWRYPDGDALRRTGQATYGTERSDGSGNLVFGQRAYVNGNSQNQISIGQFVGIANVRDVEKLIRDTFKS